MSDAVVKIIFLSCLWGRISILSLEREDQGTGSPSAQDGSCIRRRRKMAGPCVGHTARGYLSHLMSKASGVSPEQAVSCCLSEAELCQE